MHVANYILLLRLMVNLLLLLVRLSMFPSLKNLKNLLRMQRRPLWRFVLWAFTLNHYRSHLMLIGLISPLHDAMCLSCYPVYLCADNMSFSYLTPLPTSLTGRQTQHSVIFCIFFSRCIAHSIYLFLHRNSNELLQPYQCLKNLPSRYRCL